MSAKSHESAMPETFKLPVQANTDTIAIPPPSAPPVPSKSSRAAAADTSGAAKRAYKPGAPGSMPEEDQSDEDDGDVCIPTAEQIQKVKEKRLRLRGVHLAPGYVPSDQPDFKQLKDFKKTEDAIKKGSDDDDSADEPEDDIRMKFSGGARRSVSLAGCLDMVFSFFPFEVVVSPRQETNKTHQSAVVFNSLLSAICSRSCFCRQLVEGTSLQSDN